MATHFSHKQQGYHALVENGEPVWDRSTYSTHMYTDKALQYVGNHLQETPDKVGNITCKIYSYRKNTLYTCMMETNPQIAI